MDGNTPKAGVAGHLRNQQSPGLVSSPHVMLEIGDKAGKFAFTMQV